MANKPKLVHINKHDKELDDGLMELEKASLVIAGVCRRYRTALIAEGFTGKEVCRILGAYLGNL